MSNESENKILIRNNNATLSHDNRVVLFSKQAGVCGGRWCLHGRRIWPAIIKKIGIKRAFAEYPFLSGAEITACLMWKDTDSIKRRINASI